MFSDLFLNVGYFESKNASTMFGDDHDSIDNDLMIFLGEKFTYQSYDIMCEQFHEGPIVNDIDIFDDEDFL